MATEVTIPGTRKVFGDNGINGIMLLWGVAGIVLVISGVKNATIADTARALIRGQAVTGGPPTVRDLGSGGAYGVSGSGGTATGDAVAARGLSYSGVPYVFGGEDPSGWDCSGFVTWVLHHDFGIELPSNVHTVTGQFLLWGGAETIARAAASPGDLACWSTHIGICINKDQMVNAPGVGKKTRVDTIGPGVTIRRPTAYVAASAPEGQ